MYYTLEDINSKLIEPIEVDYGDIMDASLECYNYIMKYLDDKGISYYIKKYEHYYDQYKNAYFCSLDIVLEEDLQGFLKEYILDKYYECNSQYTEMANYYIINVACDMNRTRIRSRINQYLCAKKWSHDLKEEFQKLFPNYYMNINDNYMDKAHEYAPDAEFCVNGDYDYHKFYKYISKDRRLLIERLYYEKYIPGSSINVFMTLETTKKEMDKLFKKMKQFLKKYHINEVYMILLNNKNEIDRIKKEEKPLRNKYSFNDITKYNVIKEPKRKWTVENAEKLPEFKLPKIIKNIFLIIFFPIILIWIIYLVWHLMRKIDT